KFLPIRTERARKGDVSSTRAAHQKIYLFGWNSFAFRIRPAMLTSQGSGRFFLKNSRFARPLFRIQVLKGLEGMEYNGVPPDSGQIARWLAAARQGSVEALGQLLEVCRPYLLKVANDHLTADLRAKLGASDVVQEAFLEAQRDFGQFSGLTE